MSGGVFRRRGRFVPARRRGRFVPERRRRLLLSSGVTVDGAAITITYREVAHHEIDEKSLLTYREFASLEVV